MIGNARFYIFKSFFFIIFQSNILFIDLYCSLVMTSRQQMPAVGSGAAEGELDQWWLWGLQAEDFGSPGWSHGQLILWMSCPVSWKINSRGWVSFISLSPPSSLSVSEADCRYLMCERSVAFRCVWHHRCGWCPSQWRSVFQTFSS